MRHEFYSIPSNHGADAFVHLFDDCIEENGTGQNVEENVQDDAQYAMVRQDVA